ncbi:TetR/AcrR family transcriptional regulator [Cellulophaga sp. HaHaR_3_176]|uniref:TetR/AcrR family transcriptional regulator n=1 Tax=Cellulophaga sp. HaHaR_3_176 TaxID=1942464 RepID=UPI001C1FE5ED|nr:TetR/AcrR family transcriptional regulator [Cellulophaga sp. HaHaR_3_176]QWX83456.1 TetR/AcrR family transcriptional regulator [Cellulophaga sp. HaHaR_3_176]
MKKLELREHIIKVASELFYANGYNATGINEIILKAEIAKATLYSHFKSKDELCISYLKNMNDNFMNGLHVHIESKKESKLQLLGIFDYLRDLYFNPDFNGCWSIKCMAEIGKEDNEIRKEIKSQKNNLMSYLKIIINNNLPQNSNAETEKLSNAIYLLYESAISESHLHESDWPIYSARTIALQLLPKA